MTGSEIAGPRTELPLCISVYDENLPAMCTCKAVMGVSVYQILMRIPPGHPAFIRAEFPGTVLSLGNCASAVHTE